MNFQFRVSGIPKAQPRPRAVVRKSKTGRIFADAYNPRDEKLTKWKTNIKDAARPYLPVEPISGPVRLDLVFVMPRPKAHYLKAGLRPDAPAYHTGTPDRDNLEKAVMDCLTTLEFWYDDGQVCSGFIVKIYGEKPGVLIAIETVSKVISEPKHD